MGTVGGDGVGGIVFVNVRFRRVSVTPVGTKECVRKRMNLRDINDIRPVPSLYLMLGGDEN